MPNIIVSALSFLILSVLALRATVLYKPLVDFLLMEEKLLHEATLYAHINSDNQQQKEASSGGKTKSVATADLGKNNGQDATATNKGQLRAAEKSARWASVTSLPWSSISQLEKDHGSDANLTGEDVRRLYKHVLLDDKLHTWVETEIDNSDKKHTNKETKEHHSETSRQQHEAHEAFVASSCAQMRWHAKLYSRRRHDLHPFSTELLAWRDAWVHGVKKLSWRNFVSCLAQDEAYACPGMLDSFHSSIGGHHHHHHRDGEKKQEVSSDASKSDSSNKNNNKKSGDGIVTSWVKKTLKSCRRSNEWWNEFAFQNNNKKKQTNDGSDEKEMQRERNN